MENEEAKFITPDVYAQLIRLASSQKFLDLVEQHREAFRDKEGKIEPRTIPVKARSACTKAIKQFLHEEKVSSAWLEPIYDSIVEGKMDFPIENGIVFEVAGTELTDKTKSFLLIRHTTTGEFIVDQKISISITAKISVDRIIQFLKKHKKEIEYYEELLELPELPKSWGQINLALRIIRMKDEEALSFSEIASKLSNDNDVSKADKLSDDANIKKIYYRYKKYLHIK